MKTNNKNHANKRFKSSAGLRIKIDKSVATTTTTTGTTTTTRRIIMPTTYYINYNNIEYSYN